MTPAYAELLAKAPYAETDDERRANKLRYLHDETLEIESDDKENDEQHAEKRARIAARRLRNADEISRLLAEQRAQFDSERAADDGPGDDSGDSTDDDDTAA